MEKFFQAELGGEIVVSYQDTDKPIKPGTIMELVDREDLKYCYGVILAFKHNVRISKAITILRRYLKSIGWNGYVHNDDTGGLIMGTAGPESRCLGIIGHYQKDENGRATRVLLVGLNQIIV